MEYTVLLHETVLIPGEATMNFPTAAVKYHITLPREGRPPALCPRQGSVHSTMPNINPTSLVQPF